MPHSSHPPSGLRVHVLCRHISRLGLSHHGEKCRAEWEAIGTALSAKPDYFGFYSEELFEPLTATIDCMLTVVNPYHFCSQDLGSDEISVERWTPVYLVNRAWHLYHQDYDRYREWEPVAINTFIERLG